MDTLTMESKPVDKLPNALPSPAEFLAEQLGIVPKSALAPKDGTQVRVGGGSPQDAGGSNEFRALLVNYCAQYVEAYELSQVRWTALSKRLGCQQVYLIECAESFNEDGTFWIDVMALRIKQANSSGIFRDRKWENLETLALDKLMTLMERNLIRDPGEILAVAKTARAANTPVAKAPSGPQVNINIGNGDESMSENGLPAAGTRMTIDLSPRLAQRLGNRSEQIAPAGSRVIDGEMISAKELRAVADGTIEESPSSADIDETEGNT